MVHSGESRAGRQFYGFRRGARALLGWHHAILLLRKNRCDPLRQARSLRNHADKVARVSECGQIPNRIPKSNDGGFGEQRQWRNDFYKTAGERDSNTIPFPRRLSCLDSQKDSYEIGNCVQKFCAITPKARVQLGSKTTPKTVI